MKKICSICLIALFSASLFVACSSGKDGETEKGSIDKMTDRAAKGMADTIQIPLERARASAKLQEAKIGELEEAMKDR